jgi:hypothetical protein
MGPYPLHWFVRPASARQIGRSVGTPGRRYRGRHGAIGSGGGKPPGDSSTLSREAPGRVRGLAKAQGTRHTGVPPSWHDCPRTTPRVRAAEREPLRSGCRDHRTQPGPLPSVAHGDTPQGVLQISGPTLFADAGDPARGNAPERAGRITAGDREESAPLPCRAAGSSVPATCQGAGSSCSTRYGASNSASSATNRRAARDRSAVIC